jgi:hypothetical protein
MEAGEMSGGYRNQIEFSNDVAQFFRPSERRARAIWTRVRASGPLWERPLAYRGRDYGQWAFMWRLGLPTKRMGAQSYPGRIIRLERIRRAGSVYYLVHVVDATSADAASWQAASSLIGTTGGPNGREFGYW